MTNAYDVVVLGSGAAGLTAALAAATCGARVALLEKAELLGGTTALSGGTVWMPANQPARDAGIEDSREGGLAYLSSLSLGLILPELAEALIDGGPQLIDFVHQHTDLRFRLVPGYPDYHPDAPGGLPGGGRCIEIDLVSLAGLGQWADLISGDPRYSLIAETPLGGGTGVIDPEELQRRRSGRWEGLGRGLVAGLLQACLANGVDVRTGARGMRLHTRNDRVTGLDVAVDGVVSAVSARAVVLATGGFEYDAELVRDFLRGPITRPLGAPSNTGDGLRMAMRIGARLGNMQEAWWSPAVSSPGTRVDGSANAQLSARERALPGAIMVNRQGRRFANEAANYNAFGGAFHRLDESSFDYPNLPAHLIFCQQTVDRFGVFGGGPGDPVPDWVQRADRLDDLARLIDVDPDALRATVSRFNEQARLGIDPDFDRGRGVYDRYPGGRLTDPDSPAATLGPLDAGPFYGVRVESSLLGTKGGPRTDAEGRVRDVDGAVIGGLYAAGNVMANPTGMMYGGAGATLAVATVFGMFAGRAAATDSHSPTDR